VRNIRPDSLDPETVKSIGALAFSLPQPVDTVLVSLSGANYSGRPLGGPGRRIPFDGLFSERVAAGDYVVDFELSGPNDPYIKEVTYDGLTLADGGLRIASAANGTLHVVVARGTAGLTVTVADSEGKPVPDAAVVVVPQAVTSVAALARVETRGQSDQNGIFTAPSLPPGKYRVLAASRQVRWGVPEDLEKVLLMLFQAKDLNLASPDKLQVTISPLPF
jgi:hypothetical protein